jgi:hypothetical protein
VKAKEGFATSSFLLYFSNHKMKHHTNFSVRPLATAALITLAAAGCGRDNVKVYKADSSDTAVTPPPATAPGTMPTTMPDGMAVPDNSGQPKLKYTLPDGWKEKALTQMRVASFEATENGKTADISVIPLGAMSGGDLANVNRWRGQVGQPPITEADLAKSVENVAITGKPSGLYDIAGTSPGSGEAQRILGAILHGDDATWFFKMTGDADLVEKQKANFTAFLKSVSFDKTAAPAALDMSQLPPSHPAIPGMDAAAPVAVAADAAGKPIWTIPADWKQVDPGSMLSAKFSITGNNGSAEVNILSMGMDSGLAANVNRWRGQLGQTPLADADIAKLPTIDASGVKATLVDISGTDPRSNQAARLIGMIVPVGGQTWFYKLMGDATIVAQQSDAFTKFVQSAKYPDAH